MTKSSHKNTVAATATATDPVADPATDAGTVAAPAPVSAHQILSQRLPRYVARLDAPLRLIHDEHGHRDLRIVDRRVTHPPVVSAMGVVAAQRARLARNANARKERAPL